MNISEKASYLKGLLDGMKFDKTTDEGKLFYAIADLLEDISATVLDLDDEQALTNEYLEELDSDLGELEEDYYGCECCDDDCCEECGDECCCTEEDEEDDGDEDDDNADFFEAVCPHCKETIYVDSTLKGEEIVCPNCEKSFKQ
ncbi:MAG TPA: hypothetical protein PLT66_07705 [Bacillota bacterium]|nr:hypothetical protein [Bacillota bacterium]